MADIQFGDFGDGGDGADIVEGQAVACMNLQPQGCGKGCAFALAGEGVDLVINARGADALNATAEEIRRATGVQVTAIAADITAIIGFLGQQPCAIYANDFGRREEIKDLIRLWRPARTEAA